MKRRKRRWQSRTGPKLLAFYVRHLTLWLSLAFVAYCLWLDHVVGVSFAASRWAVPARIYASPLELYKGLELAPDYLEMTLGQLGYVRASTIDTPGRYRRSRHGFEISSRGYAFPERREPPRRIKIRLSGRSVAALSDIETGDPLALARLEPVEIGSVHAKTFEDRVVLSLADTPKMLLDILIAIEDRRFYQHFGVDPVGIVRAAVNNLRSGTIEQGGSTITQQLVKNLYLSNKRSYGRKIREAVMAIALERRTGKGQIVEAYVNEIFLGQDGNRAVHGFGLGARFFFGKPLEDLGLAELATLVGMVKAPSTYDPRRRPVAARKRRNLVLDLLVKQGLIGPDDHAAASASELVVRSQPIQTREFGTFMDLVRVQLRRDYKEADLQAAGLKVYTTLDPGVQLAAQNAANKTIRNIEKRKNLNAKPLQAAVIIIDPRTGEVAGLVGGRGHSRGGFNRALNAKRAIGSLVKPFVYLAALEQRKHFNVLSVLEDTAVNVSTATGEQWVPRNYDGRFHGAVSLRRALIRSYNLATVNLGLSVGVKTVVKRLQAFGVENGLSELPSILLGAIDLTPVEVTQLYQTVANDGFKVPLRAIRSVSDAHNRTLTRYPPSVERLTNASVAYLIQHLLTGVVTEGTARSAASALEGRLPLAGKTGTTNGGRDSWFAGFGANYLTVVWVGRDDNGETGLTGATGALPIWTEVMLRIGVTPFQFGRPDDLAWEWVSPTGDALVARECEGATLVPLALPHGLPDRRECASDRPVERTPLDYLRGLLH